MNQGRSLNLEHVSPVLLVQQEISRRTQLGHQAELAFKRGLAVSDQLLIAIMRKWFWARKPDAGFLLEGFPATLLQALVFDEWVEARGETLTAAFFTPELSLTDSVAHHYRTQGLLQGVIHATAA
jgi:adenylate kinase